MNQNIESITFKGAPMATASNEVQITRMPLNKIKLGRNSRANIDKDELEGLMESIKEIGLLQPIGVVKTEKGYDIAYGNRRFLACSKLGMSHIPAIVHSFKKSSEVDIKNLAENVQRKNISLMEVGRYVSLLRGEGMTVGEIGVRLGVSRSYINAAADTFANVPKTFRKDVVSIQGNMKKKMGKISAQSVQKILSAKRSIRLSPDQENKLYEAAKKDEFNPQMTYRYATLLKAGKDNFLDLVEPIKMIRIEISVTQKEFDRLESKHVAEGPFHSVTALCKAILAGNKSETIKILEAKE